MYLDHIERTKISFYCFVQICIRTFIIFISTVNVHKHIVGSVSAIVAKPSHWNFGFPTILNRKQFNTNDYRCHYLLLFFHRTAVEYSQLQNKPNEHCCLINSLCCVEFDCVGTVLIYTSVKWEFHCQNTAINNDIDSIFDLRDHLCFIW